MASSSKAQQSTKTFTSKLLLLFTVFPLSLATFAFLLQWRGAAVNDPITRWSPEQSYKFPGMDNTSPLATVGHSSSSDCSLLTRGGGGSASFPYYRDWKFNFQADLRPKLSLKVVDQMLKLGWEGDGLSPLIK